MVNVFMYEVVAGHKTAALALAGFEASGEEMELAKFLTEVYWVRRDQANYKTAALRWRTFVPSVEDTCFSVESACANVVFPLLGAPRMCIFTIWALSTTKKQANLLAFRNMILIMFLKAYGMNGRVTCCYCLFSAGSTSWVSISTVVVS